MSKEFIDNEIEIVQRALWKHKIDDIELKLDKKGNIIAKDADNVWKGKAFYDFLFNEVFVYEDAEEAKLIGQEKFKKLVEYRKKYENDIVSKSSKKQHIR